MEDLNFTHIPYNKSVCAICKRPIEAREAFYVSNGSIKHLFCQNNKGGLTNA